MKVICIWHVIAAFLLVTGMEEMNFANDVVDISIEEELQIESSSFESSELNLEGDTFEINEAQIEVSSETQIESLTSESMENATAETLHLKIFIVVDYSTYQYWITLENNDTSRAMENLRYSYAKMIEGVDKKFSYLVTGLYRYKVKLVGYYVAETPEASTFTENEDVKSEKNDNTIDYSKVFEKLHKWVLNNSNILPTYGIVVLVTGYADNIAAGRGILLKACTDRGLAVMYRGDIGIVGLASHEIGHVLGSPHDGEGNDCDPDLLYIMTASKKYNNVTNLHTYSPCSRRSFEKYISTMPSSRKEKCFKDEPSPVDDEVKKYSEILLGQRFDQDRQCQFRMQAKSYYCSVGQRSKSNICGYASCYDSSANDCAFQFHGSKAYDGTLCGNKSWCINGQCVYDERAPVANETCMFGDADINMNYDGKKTRCSDLEKKPNLCLQNYFKEMCCVTCPKVLENYNDCPNGDQESYCKQFVKFYGKGICVSAKEMCCQTCKEVGALTS